MSRPLYLWDPLTRKRLVSRVCFAILEKRKISSNTHTITQAHTHTHGCTPLHERSARPSGRCLHNTQQTQGTNILVINGILTHDPTNQTYTLERTATSTDQTLTHSNTHTLKHSHTRHLLLSMMRT